MKNENKYLDILSEYSRNIDKDEIANLLKEIKEKVDENETKKIYSFLYSCIDLTLLRSDTSKEQIYKFIENEVNIKDNIEELPDIAAVCVYPTFIAPLKEVITSDVNLACVIGGFPHSQTFEEIKIAEAALSIAQGANEIDMVMNIGKYYDENYEELSEEIQEVKFAIGENKLKIILETGLLHSLQDIYNTSILALYSGADFIKTSTGKEYKGADPISVIIMCWALKDYAQKTGIKAGIKVSGGISTVNDAILYYIIVKEILGDEYLNKDHFRIGTSKLRGLIEEAIL